ncbi:uncharacterized protein LOC117178463 [Belonocnema kinseyi]|uniref:uncharacterized protein LOC117178463 n=1 Tax=Belonocnema kinseyi TaxID=2817044 RepID=UPI00143E0DC4|nr:uncharacterized protein LOC117178463 [Belonocnema kinseyi]
MSSLRAIQVELKSKNYSCQRLVKIARTYSFFVVCDDVYNLLNYEEGLPPHRLFYFDNPKDEDFIGGTVISNGSFSKIFFLAVNILWVLKKTRMMDFGEVVNHFMSGTIESFIYLGLADEYIELQMKILRTNYRNFVIFWINFFHEAVLIRDPKVIIISGSNFIYNLLLYFNL